MLDLKISTIVLDNGSGITKAGYSGKNEPSCHFSTVVGTAKYPVVAQAGVHKDFYISEEVFAKAGVLDLTYPISYGLIKDWDNMERIWSHIFSNELKTESAEHPIFFVDSLNATIEQRQKISQIFFEKYNVPSVYFQSSDSLALLASGRTTGLVLDSGEGITSISAIFEGYKIPQSTQINKIAGHAITSYLIKKMNKDELLFQTSAERLVAQDIKEKLCYVAADYKDELEKARTSDQCKKDYQLPDGQTLQFNELRFKAPEFLFKPKLWGCEFKGLTELVFSSIMNSDVHSRKDLYENIILSGGNTLLTGFSERLNKELSALAPPSTTINIIQEQDRIYSAWKGASQLCTNEQFPKMVVTKSEYNDGGAEVIKKKCPLN
ncbi:hypothetical protein M9Y10_038928 [Tritrichomonas musculus]|uniref:Actin n=1 Tax=Tritrichomonas musculus TaxID=1915356 RepID=A0ABR2K9W0_9EUKA